MADERPSPDEPLEEFYGAEADAVPRLAGAGEDSDGEARPRPAAGEAGGGRRTTVTGALMAGIAMGLRDVFEPTYHDRTAIEQPAPEQPLEPQKYEVHLDPVAPESSFAIYRPWVDDGTDDDGTDDDGPTGREAGGAGRGAKGGGAGALGG
jgi:hypothetical protein